MNIFKPIHLGEYNLIEYAMHLDSTHTTYRNLRDVKLQYRKYTYYLGSNSLLNALK